MGSAEQADVLVAMSGGVDSTAAAVLLQEAGYKCCGATLELPDTRCCLLFEARTACADLGIPHHRFDARELFEDQIIQPYLQDIRRGRTPSPCIRCNAIVKFGWLLDRARELGCDRIATGHYARIVEREGRWHIQKAVDAEKDQSYFLFELSQDQLAHTLFPLGERHKPEIRALCRQRKLAAADQNDSQDLCFIPPSGPAEFICDRLPELSQAGQILSTNGTVLGTHQGVYRYTIGQRKGLGLGGGPWYVVELRPACNEVVVGKREDALAAGMEVQELNWMQKPPEAPMACQCRIRYNHREAPAVIEPVGADRVLVRFDNPQFAITPGQAAVFYDQDLVLGGGWITAAQ